MRKNLVPERFRSTAHPIFRDFTCPLVFHSIVADMSSCSEKVFPETKKRKTELNFNDGEALKCPICLNICSDQPVTLVSCTHSFCSECLLSWFRLKTECPLCKSSDARFVQFRHLHSYEHLSSNLNISPKTLADVVLWDPHPCQELVQSVNSAATVAVTVQTTSTSLTHSGIYSVSTTSPPQDSSLLSSSVNSVASETIDFGLARAVLVHRQRFSNSTHVKQPCDQLTTLLSPSVSAEADQQQSQESRSSYVAWTEPELDAAISSTQVLLDSFSTDTNEI